MPEEKDQKNNKSEEKNDLPQAVSGTKKTKKTVKKSSQVKKPLEVKTKKPAKSPAKISASAAKSTAKKKTIKKTSDKIESAPEPVLEKTADIIDQEKAGPGKIKETKIAVKFGNAPSPEAIKNDADFKLVLEGDPAKDKAVISAQSSPEAMPVSEKAPALDVDDSGSFMQKLRKAGLMSDTQKAMDAAAPAPAAISAPITTDAAVPVQASPMAVETPATDDVFVQTKGHSLSLYKKIAVSFIGLTLILVAVIAYFSFSKLTITIVPSQEKIDSNIVLDIHDKNKTANPTDDMLLGRVDQVQLSLESAEPVSSSESMGEELTGKVTIYNNYIKNQPLVASTRLLTSDNKLFRIKDTVNVPAGGSVEVEVYADQPGKDMETAGPARFTLPGLWAGIQDKIYGESKDGIGYQKLEKRIVKQEDIDAGVTSTKAKLLEKAKTEIKDAYQDFEQVLYSLDDSSLEISVGAKTGEEKNELPIKIKAIVNVVAFNDDQAYKYAQDKVLASLPAGKELLGFDKQNITYSLSSFDYAQGMASVNAAVQAKIVMKSSADSINRNALVGLTKTQLDQFLSSQPEIAGFSLIFQPTFIKKAPSLVDRITIEVKR